MRAERLPCRLRPTDVVWPLVVLSLTAGASLPALVRGQSLPDSTVGQPAPDSALRIEELLDITQKDPSDSKAWTQLGILYIEEGLFEEARDAFISALQAAPGEPQSHLNLGLALVRMERWEEAKVPLQSYRTMEPTDVRGPLLLGQAYAHTGDLETARRTWLEGIETPGMPEADRRTLLEELVSTTLDREEGEVSAEELRTLADLLEAHPELLEGDEGARLRSTRDYCWLEIARRAEEAGDEDSALQAWAHLREIGSTAPAAYTQAIEILLDAGRLDEAEALVHEAKRRMPDAALPDYLAGRVAAVTGDHRAAADHYRAAERKDPEIPGLYAALGGALAQIGDAQGAARAFAEARKRGEGGAAAAFNMGVVLSQKGRYAEAIDPLREAIADDPTLKDAYRALGAAYKKLKRYREAAQTYQQLVDRFGPDPGDLYQLAYARAKAGEHEQAAENYAMVTALQPDNANAHYNLGNSLLKLGRFEKAAEEFTRALEIKPDWYAARYNRALALQKQGRYEEAIEQYELALDLRETYAIYVNMAICYKELGDEESSEEFYRLAHELKTKGR